MLVQAAERSRPAAPSASGPAYALKESPASSHSVILRLAGQGGGRRLLDVGAADGFLARRLTAQGWEVTGIEGNPELAGRAQSQGSRIVIADLSRSLPELEGRFDVIVYGDVLEHLAQPQDVFGRLNRFLAPGGAVILSMPNIAHLWIRLQLLLGRFRYAERGILDRTHLRFFTLATFREFLRQEGIRCVEMQATPAPLELVVPERWQGPWLKLLQEGHALAARLWPGGLAYQFVAKGVQEP